MEIIFQQQTEDWVKSQLQSHAPEIKQMAEQEIKRRSQEIKKEPQENR
jgi:hypothetical protein